MNCLNTNTCGTSSYKVLVDSVTKKLSGYAWSDAVGWIQFGGLASVPTGPNNDAQIVGNNLVGWAKAVSGDTTCGSAAHDSLHSIVFYT